jgi:hypothetical protein
VAQKFLRLLVFLFLLLFLLFYACSGLDGLYSMALSPFSVVPSDLILDVLAGQLYIHFRNVHDAPLPEWSWGLVSLLLCLREHL